MLRLPNFHVQMEPIEFWPGKRRTGHISSPFKADFERSTRQLLDKELRMVGAKNVVMQIDCSRSDFRVDGQLRRDARLRSPGVILRFDSKNGPVTIPCDRFNEWTDNVRAIALALEALRAVDRYGVTTSGEQYRGWQALPAPSPESIEREIVTRDQALAFLKKLVSDFRAGSIGEAEAIRKAQLLTHPDRGGDAQDFKRVMRCVKLLVPEKGA